MAPPIPDAIVARRTFQAATIPISDAVPIRASRKGSRSTQRGPLATVRASSVARTRPRASVAARRTAPVLAARTDKISAPAHPATIAQPYGQRGEIPPYAPYNPYEPYPGYPTGPQQGTPPERPIRGRGYPQQQQGPGYPGGYPGYGEQRGGRGTGPHRRRLLHTEQSA